MARILQSNSGYEIDIDASVGAGGQNAREDVGVVQYALRELYAAGKLKVPGQGAITIDGWYGNQTAAYIQAYQNVRYQLPAPSQGSLPPPAGRFSADRSNVGWRFSLLATDVRKSQGFDLLHLLHIDKAAPPWLRAAFFK